MSGQPTRQAGDQHRPAQTTNEEIMADIYDQAEATEQLFLNVALSHRKPELQAKGTCHWCLAPVSGDAHFCDADCRDDFEQDQRRRG